jgi:hypothetical protein
MIQILENNIESLNPIRNEFDWAVALNGVTILSRSKIGMPALSVVCSPETNFILEIDLWIWGANTPFHEPESVPVVSG